MSEEVSFDLSPKLLTRALAVAGVGLYAIDPEHRRMTISAEMASLLGLEGARAMPVDEYLERFHRAEDRAEVAEMVGGRRGGVQLEARVLHAGGKLLWARMRASLEHGEDGQQQVVGLFQDISGERATQEARLASEARLRGYFASPLVGLAVTSPEKGFVEVNERICEMLGYPREELLACDWAALTFPDDLEADVELFKGLLAGKIDHYTLHKRFVRKDGQVIWAIISVHALRRSDGSIDSLGGVMQDITELRQAELKLQQAKKMEAVGLLAGGVAHDFNNLLSVIEGYSAVLLHGLDAGHPMRDGLGEIQRATEQGAHLTRQLLAFSRKQVLAPRVVDLHVIVVSMERMLERLIGEGVRLVAPPVAEPVWVLVDPGQIERVLMNLAVNARDAMPAGGTLTLHLTRAAVGAPEAERMEIPAGRYAVLSVTDTGQGIDEATQKRIFDPFFTTKAAGQGTGLGLSTAFGIARQSGGHIDVQSEPGRGATFRVWLPLCAAPGEKDSLA